MSREATHYVLTWESKSGHERFDVFPAYQKDFAFSNYRKRKAQNTSKVRLFKAVEMEAPE